jgi:uncharacterized protein YcbX
VHFRPDHDLQGSVAQLFIYPVKSCAGFAVPEALLTATGLQWDRHWMVVDARGDFITQRDEACMALVHTAISDGVLVLRTPGMPDLEVAADQEGPLLPVRVWDDVVPAYSAGPAAAAWFSEVLGRPCQLVRFEAQHRRLSSLKWTGGFEAPNQFADGYPILVTSKASLHGLNARLQAVGQAPVGMERFRPNLVIEGVEEHDEDRIEDLYIAAGQDEAHLQLCKPCVRCPIPDIDPATAVRGTVVGDMLRTYRSNARMKGGVTFGMNAVVRSGLGLTLQVGQSLAAQLRFD